METKYRIGQLVETERGTVGRIFGIRTEHNQEMDKPDWSSVAYKVGSFPGARGFYIPESDIKRVLEA